MIDRKLTKEVCWTANARVDSVNSDILKLMKAAGCIWLCYGFETGSEKVMKAIKKNTTVQQNINTAKMTKDEGILVAATRIAGVREEHEEDFWDSYNFIEKIQPFSSGFNIFTLLPGTEYYKEFYKTKPNGKDNKDWRELGLINVKKSKSYCSIDKDTLVEMIQKANQRDSYFSNKNYYKFNFLKNQQQALIRYSYTGEHINVFEEECYKLYFKAFDYYKRRDFIGTIKAASKAIDNRVCLLPCPCPSGCCFHYDLNYIIALSYFKNKNYKKAIEISKKYCNEKISGFSFIDFIGIISECYKRLGRSEEASRFMEEIKIASMDQKKYRKIPRLYDSENPTKICANLIGVIDVEENIYKESVLSEEKVQLDCVVDSNKILVWTKPVALAKGKYSLYYKINSYSGNIKIEIFKKNKKSMISAEHSVSTFNILDFELKKDDKINVSISLCEKKLPKYVNLELLKLQLLNR
jgi:hypothetical protein